MRPIAIVDGLGFKTFVESLDPRYKLPTRQRMTNSIIPRLTEAEKKRISELLHNTKWVSITTDMWSSLTMTSFMAITVHFLDGDNLSTALMDCSSFHQRHTSQNITTRLHDVIADYDISEKMVCAVSDNAANVTKAIADAQIIGVPCFAHTLNNSIMDSLKASTDFEPLRKKIVDLASFLHRSNVGKEDLVACQLRLQAPIRAFLGDCKTRWNSVFIMLARFLENKEALLLFQCTESGKDYIFTNDEWEMAANVKLLLEPAYEATVELSGDSYVSGSKVIPITKSLLQWYAEAKRRHQRAEPGGFKMRFADTILQKLYTRLHNAESVHVLALATLCDPRYKCEAFIKAENATVAVNQLKAEMRKMAPDVAADLSAVQPRREERGTSLWDSFDKAVINSATGGLTNPQENAISAEVLKYLKMANIPRTAYPLAWWSTVGRALFPVVSEVARKFLIIPATSVPSERVFSAAGNIITKKRSALSDSAAAHLIFLRENMPKKKK
jgi:hypothetical protein